MSSVNWVGFGLGDGLGFELEWGVELGLLDGGWESLHTSAM